MEIFGILIWESICVLVEREGVEMDCGSGSLDYKNFERKVNNGGLVCEVLEEGKEFYNWIGWNIILYIGVEFMISCDKRISFN